jgi:hypothetical protein
MTGRALAAAPHAAPGRAPRAATAAVLIVALVGAATIAGLIAGGGSPALTLSPIALFSLVWAGWKAPLRLSASALLFLLLALEVGTDAGGLWHTPLASLGDLLRDNLEVTLHLPGVKLAGVDVVVIFLAGAWAIRKVTGSTIDGDGGVESAAVLRGALILYVASVAFAFANGLATGGTVAIWQVRRLLHVPVLFLFFSIAYRGPQDHVLLGRIVVGAACVKAFLAILVQRIAIAQTGGKLAHATNHGDSILFALAIVILVVSALERAERGQLVRTASLVGLLLVGARENGRRLVWVGLAMSLGAVYLLEPWTRWKRAVTRLAIASIPIALLYVAVGWNAGGSLFAPVRYLRSISDSAANRSTLWREVENWNISVSMQDRPLLGAGLGKEYVEHMPNDDISFAYPEYRFWPHNSVLGLLLFGGLFAFTGIWSLFAMVVFLASRSLRRATDPNDRAAALAAICTVIVCINQAYGDLGAAFTQYRVLLALALAVVGKLAVATGAWPRRLRTSADGATTEVAV